MLSRLDIFPIGIVLAMQVKRAWLPSGAVVATCKMKRDVVECVTACGAESAVFGKISA